MIVGFTGYARSGKSTAAEVLRTSAGFTLLAFADPIKDLLVRLDPPIWRSTALDAPRLSSLLGGTDLEALKSSNSVGYQIRRWLQDLGVECRNVLGPDVWVDALAKRWESSGFPALVIPDVRFPNEFDWIHRNGGKIVRVLRPGTGPANDHISETGTEYAWTDHIIVNDGSAEDLSAAVIRYATVQGLLR